MTKHNSSKLWTAFPLLLILSSWLLLAGCEFIKKSESEPPPVYQEVPSVNKTPPDWSKNLSIYEVNLRQYSASGSFSAFAEHLPRLKALGVDIIWLMPIFPIGNEQRKGTLGSYYAVRDYKGVNPEHGTGADFRQLVDQIHEQGMYVILDWVANHTAWDNPLTKDHPDWYTKDSLGNFIPPVADWSDVIDLDYSKPALQDYMIDAMSYWVREYDVDGFRCDVAEMVPVAFWNKARKALDKIKPVFMLAEGESPNLHHKAFDMTYTWRMMHLMNRIAKGKGSALELDRYLEEEKEQYNKKDYRMYFTTNHDENSWNGTVYERYGEGYKAFAVMTHTLPGMPLVYSGQEAGLPKRLKFFEKDPIDWQDHPMADFFKKLLAFKKEHRVMWNGSYGGDIQRIKSSDDESVFAFIRQKHEKKVLVLLNLTKDRIDVSLQTKGYEGKYQELFTGTQMAIHPETRLNLGPWAYIVCYN